MSPWTLREKMDGGKVSLVVGLLAVLDVQLYWMLNIQNIPNKFLFILIIDAIIVVPLVLAYIFDIQFADDEEATKFGLGP